MTISHGGEETMKKSILFLSAGLLAVAFAASCASYRSYTVPEQPTEEYAAVLNGKTLTIMPFEIDFHNSRGIIAVEYFKVGDTYTKRYAVEEENLTLNAPVGIFQRNILNKVKLSQPELMRAVLAVLKEGSLGRLDYHYPFMKGLGSGNMGTLSNRPVSTDTSTTPVTVSYLPPIGPLSYFSSVRAVGEADAATSDYYLEGEVTLDNEILHVLGAPMPMSGTFERAPKMNDYYLSIWASITFRLYDAKTGAEVVTHKTKLLFPMYAGYKKLYYISMDDPDDFYELDSFLALDYSSYAKDAVARAAETILPWIAPYVANVQYMEKIEE